MRRTATRGVEETARLKRAEVEEEDVTVTMAERGRGSAGGREVLNAIIRDDGVKIKIRGIEAGEIDLQTGGIQTLNPNAIGHQLQETYLEKALRHR